MKKTTISVVLAALCLNFSASGQAQKAPMPLKIGDTLPVNSFKNIINSKPSAIDVKSLQGKFIILNFWTTWCSSCIKSFPKEDALYQKFKDKIQVFMVNGNDGDFEKGVQIVLNRYKENTGKRLGLPVIYPGNYITNLFSFASYPHVVWIDQQGKIMAITDGESLTESNFAKLLRGEHVAFRYKTD